LCSVVLLYVVLKRMTAYWESVKKGFLESLFSAFLS